MKSLMMLFIASVFLCTAANAQEGYDLAAVETAVKQFSGFGDQQDADQLDAVLHPQFRAVVNRLFGSEEVSTMDKRLYLQLVREKKIGGDTREVHLLDVDLVNNNATVKAVFLGEALRFTTFLSLVKNADGSWQVIGDFPEIEKV